MAQVVLRPPLRELAGGSSRVEVEGETVGEIIAQLEQAYPRLTGWVTDERGRIRQHVSIFVNQERADVDAVVGPADRVHVLPAISGGAVRMAERTKPVPKAGAVADPGGETELLVGTRKGLFVLRGPRGGAMREVARKFDGTIAEYAMRDPRTGTYFCSVTHGQYGPRLYFTDDPSGEWEQAEGPAFPEGGEAAVERIWKVTTGVEEGVLWAGVAPAALFRSGDGGRTWELNQALWDDPSRPSWNPGAGGLALHSICTWPGRPEKLAIGISAAGVWLSDDGGASWRRSNTGLVPLYMPEEVRSTSTDLCVHNMHRTALDPTTIYMQFHGGVYRSDDAGESWIDIGGDDLPSRFGFPLVADPNDPDHAFIIPLQGDYDRVTPAGAVRVWETRDRGASWSALGEGLPGDRAYLTVLRQAFGHDGRDPLGLYFGAESGEVFGSADGGVTWATVADHLPPVVAVRVTS